MDKDEFDFRERLALIADGLRHNDEYEDIGLALLELVIGIPSKRVKQLIKNVGNTGVNYPSLEYFHRRLAAHKAADILTKKHQMSLNAACNLIAEFSEFKNDALRKEFSRETSLIVSRSESLLKILRAGLNEMANSEGDLRLSWRRTDLELCFFTMTEDSDSEKDTNFRKFGQKVVEVIRKKP